MKCPKCFALNLETDKSCYGCGASLAGGGWNAASGSWNDTPGWAYVFASLCGAIPVVALGGCVPALLGFGGGSMCLGLARWRALPVVLRVLGCILITGGAWILFVALVAATMRVMKK